MISANCPPLLNAKKRTGLAGGHAPRKKEYRAKNKCCSTVFF
jgi:hypothetical protein